MASTNYSVYAIPVYCLLTLAPHNWAISKIKAANNGRWINSNPRSPAGLEKIRTAVPAEIFGRFERAEAAHKNGMEGMALFCTAIVLGNMAELPAGTLNTVSGVYLALRVAYTVAYIRITSNRHSLLRTAIWASSTLLLLYQVVLAANVFASPRVEKSL